jgi:hypothetical protein
LVFKEFAEVDEVGKVRVLALVDLVLDGLDLCKNAVAGIDQGLPISEFKHTLFFDFLVDQGSDYVFAVFNDLQQGHIEAHLLEAFTFLVDAFDGLEVFNDGVVLGERNIFDVDHHFVQRDVVVAAQLKLHLHGAHQHHVNTLVLYVEFSLLVVQSVQNILQIADFGQVRPKVVQKSLMIEIDSVRCSLVDTLSIFEKTTFLDFLVSEELFEELVVSQIEESVEGSELWVLFSLEIAPQSTV